MMKKSIMAVMVAAAIGATGAQAAQIQYGAAVTTTGNNFTSLDPGGGFVGGATDVTMTWDGTIYTSQDDVDITGATSNMTLSSPTKFFFFNWTAYGIQVFGTGTYTFDTALNNAGGNAESGIQTLTVGAGQLGAHMLWGFKGNLGLDISIVWDANCAFSGDQTLSGSGQWDACSVDGNGDGMPGIPMALGGPIGGFYNNYNLNGITPNPVPVPAAIWLFGSGLLGMIGFARKKHQG